MNKFKPAPFPYYRLGKSPDDITCNLLDFIYKIGIKSADDDRMQEQSFSTANDPHGLFGYSRYIDPFIERCGK